MFINLLFYELPASICSLNTIIDERFVIENVHHLNVKIGNLLSDFCAEDNGVRTLSNFMLRPRFRHYPYVF